MRRRRCVGADDVTRDAPQQRRERERQEDELAEEIEKEDDMDDF